MFSNGMLAAFHFVKKNLYSDTHTEGNLMWPFTVSSPAYRVAQQAQSAMIDATVSITSNFVLDLSLVLSKYQLFMSQTGASTSMTSSLVTQNGALRISVLHSWLHHRYQSKQVQCWAQSGAYRAFSQSGICGEGGQARGSEHFVCCWMES